MALYFSGTSQAEYDLLALASRRGHAVERTIWCYGDEQYGPRARPLAVAFAFKRAKQDNSTPLIITIHDIEGFHCELVSGAHRLRGRLTPENHFVEPVTVKDFYW